MTNHTTKKWENSKIRYFAHLVRYKGCSTLFHFLKVYLVIESKKEQKLTIWYSFLWVVISSANLFLYLHFNKTFRDNFISIFSCTKSVKTNQNVLGIYYLSSSTKYQCIKNSYQQQGCHQQDSHI